MPDVPCSPVIFTDLEKVNFPEKLTEEQFDNYNNEIQTDIKKYTNEKLLLSDKLNFKNELNNNYNKLKTKLFNLLDTVPYPALPG